MPPKKRLKTSRTRFADREGSSTVCSTTSASTEAPQQPAVAKPRRALRGRRGGLKDMPDMPLDILLEIMKALHPRDLLNLARTTKDFRSFLMSREKSASLWKASRAQLSGLPPLPPFLSEPAYANLMFFNRCHNCLKTTVRGAFWCWGVRYCRETCSDNLILGIPPPIMKEVENELGDAVQSRFLSYISCASRRSRYVAIYYKPEVDASCEKWKIAGSEEAKIKLVNECAKEVREREKLGYALKAWDEKQKQNKKEERQDRVDARYHAVLDRLRLVGWEKDVEFMDSKDCARIYSLPSVKKPTNFTDRVWKGMQGEVTTIMQTIRCRRLAQERQELLRSRLHLLREAFEEQQEKLGITGKRHTSEDEANPASWGIAGLPEFRALVDAKPEVNVSKGSFAQLLDQWPALVATWKEQYKVKFTQVAVNAMKESPAATAENVLDLAVTMFRCRDCYGLTMRWPDILAHPCFRRRDNLSSQGSDYAEAVYAVLGNRTLSGPHAPWAHFNERLEETRNIVRACGQSPDTVTFEAMQACPIRLKCKVCAKPDRYIFFDWLGAVMHWANKHSVYVPSIELFEVVPQEHAAQAASLARKLISKEMNVSAYGQSAVHWFSCAWCSMHSKWASLVVTHIKEKHGIAEPVQGNDIYTPDDLELSFNVMPLVWMFLDTFAGDAKVKDIVEAGKGFFAPYPALAPLATTPTTIQVSAPP